MFRSYLLAALRNLKRDRTSSILNIAGLAVGMTAFVLIVLYVRFELSYDKYHEDSDRIFRVVREGRAFTPAALGPALEEKIPEVSAAVRLIRTPQTLVSREDGQFLEEDFCWAEPGAIELFSLSFVAGDPKTALNAPSGAVLSRSAAVKFFGTADPLGKRLKVNDRDEFQVTGVFKDMPANSHFVMSAIVPYRTYFSTTGNDITKWTSNFSYTYVRLNEGADPKAAAGKIASLIETPLFRASGAKPPYPRYFFLQPLTEIHLGSRLLQEMGPNNDRKFVYLLASIACLILVIACINYMNLATARSLRRGKEVGLRKVVGAARGQLVAQYLGESVVLAGLAMLASILLVLLALPAFRNLVERPLAFRPLENPGIFLGLVLLTLIVGVSAGAYPAIRMSGFRPISTLRGASAGGRQRLSLRNVLVLFQFAATIALIVCTLAVREQMAFIRTADLGFVREQIITLPVRSDGFRRNLGAMKTELLGYPEIVAVSASARLPDNIDTFTSRDWTGRNPAEPIPIYYLTADHDFAALFGIGIARGRNFSRDFPSDERGAFLVNETAVKVAGWESPVGRKFENWNGRTGTIVGVIKDFHSQSLHHPIAPLYIFLDPGNVDYLSIKIRTADLPAVLDRVKGIYRKYSFGAPFAYAFFDEAFERAYLAEQRLGKIFGAFSVLAIFVACLGLFGLAAFAAEQRTREVGIRKVLGASASSLFLLLSREFIAWVFLANVLAWPVAFLAMSKWLRGFAYRIDLGVVPFLVSAGTALAIAYLTVSLQTLKSARANPVASIKHQ